MSRTYSDIHLKQLRKNEEKKLSGEPGLRFETAVSARITQSKNCLTLADGTDVVP